MSGLAESAHGFARESAVDDGYLSLGKFDRQEDFEVVNVLARVCDAVAEKKDRIAVLRKVDSAGGNEEQKEDEKATEHDGADGKRRLEGQWWRGVAVTDLIRVMR